MSEEQNTNTEAEKQLEPPSLTDVFKAFSGAPDQEQIDKWKLEFNEVFVSGVSETELFVFRPLLRPEWIKLQTLAADPESKIDQYMFEEMIVDTCLLWKSISKPWSQCKAGLVPFLHEQVMQNSAFHTPQAASILCARL